MDQVKIGTFIAKLRKEKGLTQDDLANLLGVTGKSVSRWETGKTMPDYSILKSLCEELGITVNELINGERIEKDEAIEKYDTNLYNVLNVYDKEKKKSNRFEKILIVIGAIVLGWIIRMIIGVVFVFLLTVGADTYDNSNINNYSTYLEEYKSHEKYDVHSGMEIFPENVDATKIQEFKNIYSEGLFDGSYLFYLVVNYNEEEFVKEEERIKNLSATSTYYEGVFNFKNPTEVTKYPLYTEYGFKYPAYVTVFDPYVNQYEYALFDRENTRIIYVLDQLYEWDEISEDYIPDNYSVPKKYVDTPNKGFNMYYGYDSKGNGSFYKE